MDPATIALAAQTMNLLTQTLIKYSNGEITADQAKAMFQASAKAAQDAMDSFDNTPDGAKTGG